MTAMPGFTDILRARKRIAPHLRRTPVEVSASLSARLGVPVHLKLEHHQVTGSFKMRGATNAVLALPSDRRDRGVVAVSTGNHGRALAYAARAAGGRAVICMSRLVPPNKVQAIRELGAETRITGASQDEAQEEVERLVREEGMTMIPPFDHRDVIAGQGTLGLELAEDLPDLATAVVPVSGGGLIAGVALALKTVNPAIRIIGVSMERGAAMHESRRAGRPVAVTELPSLADSLGGGIGLDNRYTFALVRDLVDDLVLVGEDAIAAAMRHLYREERQVVEGAAAVGVAAIAAGLVPAEGPTALLLTGGNVDMAQHEAVIGGAAPVPPAA